MANRNRPRWAEIALLSVPALLAGLGFWLHGTRPVKLMVDEVQFKQLPKLSFEPATMPNNRWTAMQIVIFVDHPREARPAWWGNRVYPGLRRGGVSPHVVSSRGQRSFSGVWEINDFSFDETRQQYRAALYYVVPASADFSEQGTFRAAFEIRQGRCLGIAEISAPVRPLNR